MTVRAVGCVAAAVVAVCGATFALRAQPAPLPQLPTEPLPPLVVPEPITDPAVEPAQFKKTSAELPQPAAPRPVADPPPPVVRVQVRVPADSAPGDDIKYVLTVTNSSQADAHRVTVRNPIPDGIEKVVSANPQYDQTAAPAKEVTWSLGTLKGGQTKTIELLLKPKADAKEVKNLAYVRFEHGEATVTRIARPGLKVSRTAPKQAVKDEPFTVRVLVENTGRVSAEQVKLVETLTATAQLDAVTTGVKRTRPDENQWQWDIGTLLPGQRKVVEYRVHPTQAGDALGTTVVSADKGVLAKDEGRTQVLVPGLQLRLEGPKGVVAPGDAANYEILVKNTGTLPSTNVKIAGTVPADCRPTKKTDGGQIYRDAIVWNVPRIEPGESVTVRYSLKAATSGRRVVVASASDARKSRDSQELATVFQGTAALVWEQVPDPATVYRGKTGTVTVRVRNSGGEESRNTRVEVELPPEVALVQGTPTPRADGAKVVFPADVIPAGGERVYTITYRAERAGQAWFRFRLAADSLGDRPVTTEKAVEVLGGG